MAAPDQAARRASRPRPGRYHLYVSLACPWAHRTLIFRKLKGLEDMISVDVVSPLMYDKGWVFDPSQFQATEDRLFGNEALYDRCISRPTRTIPAV
jgi:putative glutathione S-transferase